MSDGVMDKTCKTLSVPEAGRLYFNLGRNASYEAAKRGDIPTVQLGRIVRAPVVALERMLAEAGQTTAVKRPDPPSDAENRKRHTRRAP
jgi:hypothetical protein